MEIRATVKLVGETKTGVSQRTGNEWKSCSVMLEWIDSEGTQRLWGSIFNDKMDNFERQGITAGNDVVARLRFSVRTFRTGYSAIDAEVEEINKINQ